MVNKLIISHSDTRGFGVLGFWGFGLCLGLGLGSLLLLYVYVFYEKSHSFASLSLYNLTV